MVGSVFVVKVHKLSDITMWVNKFMPIYAVIIVYHCVCELCIQRFAIHISIISFQMHAKSVFAVLLAMQRIVVVLTL